MPNPVNSQDRDIASLLNLYATLQTEDNSTHLDAQNTGTSSVAAEIAKNHFLKNSGTEAEPDFTFTVKHWYDKVWGAIRKFFGWGKSAPYDFSKHFQTLQSTFTTIVQHKIDLLQELPDHERKKLDTLRKILNDMNKHVHPNSDVRPITNQVLTAKQVLLSNLKEQGVWCEDDGEIDTILLGKRCAVKHSSEEGKPPYQVHFKGSRMSWYIYCTSEELNNLLKVPEEDFLKTIMKQFLERHCNECKTKGDLFFMVHAHSLEKDVKSFFKDLSKSAQQVVISQYAQRFGYKDFAFKLLVDHLRTDGKWSDHISTVRGILLVGAPYVACYTKSGQKILISIRGKDGKLYDIDMSEKGFLSFVCEKKFNGNVIREDIDSRPTEGQTQTETHEIAFDRYHIRIKKGDTALARLQLAYAIKEIENAAREDKGKKEAYKQLVGIILKVNLDDDAAIKKEYRKLTLQVHPDKHPEHIELFKFLNSLMVNQEKD